MNSRTQRLSALLLLTTILSACSGSIFSENKPAPTPPPSGEAPAATANRPLVNDSSSSSSNTTPVAPPTNNTEETAPRASVVSDVSILNIYEILAPSKVSEWTERMNDRQQKELLTRLSLDIVIGKATKNNNLTVRNVSFYISKDGKNVSSGQDSKAPFVTVAMEVNKDETIEGIRSFVANGHLLSGEYQPQLSPFIALSLKFKKSNSKFVITEAKFIEYVNGDPQNAYRMDGNTRMRVSIQ
jgi:hypothetical protein